ncbi:MAG: ANTAR domain-containing protein [Lachnospiraceae bacterium]|nr:ANTAR domain-containing protein [Lachnospiraceae bacterium]MCD8398978.1 ANTAR domain-containing protein [Lachnospiraceae bacterium]
MTNVNIVVVFPKPEDAKSVRNLLIRSGYGVRAVCTSGAQALSAADRLGSGVIVCGYKFADMVYSELFEDMPSSFGMLLVASARAVSEGISDGVLCVTMPFHVNDLLDSLETVIAQMERRRRRKRSMAPQRSEEEKKLIEEAKSLLMERNGMTEEEAHHYLQKTSMDSGTNMVETAQMLFALMR